MAISKYGSRYRCSHADTALIGTEQRLGKWKNMKISIYTEVRAYYYLYNPTFKSTPVASCSRFPQLYLVMPTYHLYSCWKWVLAYIFWGIAGIQEWNFTEGPVARRLWPILFSLTLDRSFPTQFSKKYSLAYLINLIYFKVWQAFTITVDFTPARWTFTMDCYEIEKENADEN
jgi:hypothetical protein